MFENCDDVDSWPSCLHFMKDLDEICRCPICYDFMQAPMMLPNCDHNFCSLCIRQFFIHKEHCPVCFSSASSNLLRNNRILERAVLQLNKIRKYLLELVKRNGISTETCENVTSPSQETSILENGNSPQQVSVKYSKNDTQKDRRKIKTRSQNVEDNVQMTWEELITSNEPSSLHNLESAAICEGDSDVEIISDNSSSRIGKPESPPCSLMSKAFASVTPKPKTIQSKLFSHMKMLTDKRTTTPADKPSPSSDDLELNMSWKDDSRSLVQEGLQSSGNSANKDIDGSLNTLPTNKDSVKTVACPVCGVPVLSRAINSHLDSCLSQADKKLMLRQPEMKKHMTKLVYNLMSDKDIRKRLRDLGLSTDGDRQMLIKRHHDFTLLYNANCDALVSKDMSVLKKEFEDLQQMQKKLALKESPAGQMVLHFTKNSSQEDIEKAQKLYARKHKKQFKSLIKQTRSAMVAAKQKIDGSVQLHPATNLCQVGEISKTDCQQEERTLSHLESSNLKQECDTKSSPTLIARLSKGGREACSEIKKDVIMGTQTCGQEGLSTKEHTSEEHKIFAQNESTWCRRSVKQTVDDCIAVNSHCLECVGCRDPGEQCEMAVKDVCQVVSSSVSAGVQLTEAVDLNEVSEDEKLDSSLSKKLPKVRHYQPDAGNISGLCCRNLGCSKDKMNDACKTMPVNDEDTREGADSDVSGRSERENSTLHLDIKTAVEEQETVTTKSCARSILKSTLKEMCSSVPSFKKSLRFAQAGKSDPSSGKITPEIDSFSQAETSSNSKKPTVSEFPFRDVDFGSVPSQEEHVFLSDEISSAPQSVTVDIPCTEDTTHHDPSLVSEGHNPRRKRRRVEEPEKKDCNDNQEIVSDKERESSLHVLSRPARNCGRQTKRARRQK